MVDTTALVLTKQYQTAATQWLESLKRNENVSVVFFPKTDRSIRFQQFLQDRAFMKSVLGKDARFFFQILHFDTHNVEDQFEMYDRIADQMNFSRLIQDKMDFRGWLTYLKKRNVTLVLVLPQAEKFLSNGSSNILSYLSHIVDAYSDRIISLCFFEADITHIAYSKLLPGSTRLYQNIHYYPLYPPEDTRAFIRYLGKKWGRQIPQKLETSIVELCGGHFWLVKEAVRQVVGGHPNPFGQEGMLFRLRTVYEFLSPTERSALTKTVLGKKNFDDQEQESVRYFKKINFFDDRGRCRVALFKDFIKNNLEKRGEFTIENNKIVLNDVPIDRMFSRQEQRVFRLLLEHKGNVLTRETIAGAIWPVKTQENYSDWAIDQLIARLRKRLSELSLSPQLLRAVRGKGYLLSPDLIR